MSLSNLFLVLTLLTFGAIGLGWVNFDLDVVYWLAIITGVLMLLEGLSVWSWSTPGVRRRRADAV